MVFLNTEHVPSHSATGQSPGRSCSTCSRTPCGAVLGVGIGVLIRSQIAATVTAVVLYLVGTQVASALFVVLSNWLDQEWIEQAQVIVPSIASSLMISGIQLPGNPPQWVGAAVLIGYTVVTGAIGTMIMRQRDIA